jgi:hypothetical protein
MSELYGEMRQSIYLDSQMEILNTSAFAHNGRKVLEMSREPDKSLSDVSLYIHNGLITDLARNKSFRNSYSDAQSISSTGTSTKLINNGPWSLVNTLILRVQWNDSQAAAIDVAQDEGNLSHLCGEGRHVRVDVVVHA